MRSDSMIFGMNRLRKNSISHRGSDGALQRCDSWLVFIFGFTVCGKTPIRSGFGKGTTSVVPLSLSKCGRALAPEVCFCAPRHFFRGLFSRRGQTAAQEVLLPQPVTGRWAAALAFAVGLAASGCGYRTAGHAVELPQNIHTIAIPGFVSRSQTFRIEQLLTDAVVREFDARTQYRVIHEAKGDADAVLKATVLSASATPLAYDSQTGRAASALITVSIQVTLTDRQGKVLFQNPSYLFHDQYELSRDLPFSRSVRTLARSP